MTLYLIALVVSAVSWWFVDKVGYKRHPVPKKFDDFVREFPDKSRSLPTFYNLAFTLWSVMLFFLFVSSVKKLPSSDGTPVLWVPLLAWQGWCAVTSAFELATGLTFRLKNRWGWVYSVKDYPGRSALLQLSLFIITVFIYIRWLQL